MSPHRERPRDRTKQSAPPVGKSEWLNRSGIPIDLSYGPERAGQYPFTRGVQADMYRGRLWTMRQYAGFGTARESNRRYRYLLERGTTGLSVAFDLPTQLGFDPDHPRALGEVGRVGVSIATLDDMRTLFAGIDLARVSTSMTINATASILLGFYVTVAKEGGVALRDLRGTIQNDILKEYVARGNFIYPPEAALRITADLFEWCSRELPKWNPISISGYHIREAGASAVQELAFTFADAIAYVEAGVRRGLNVDQFGGQLSFFFNVHNDFFEEIAKFRAARRIWARLMQERFGARDARTQMLRFHAQTAGSTLTAQQPQNNVVRVALQALAAVLGGTQSLHTNALDEALGLPTEESALLALRTQQIIATETQVTQTVDPLGGSHFVEHLTSELERRAWTYLEEIDRRGGTIACIQSGYIQTEISSQAYRDQKSIESGELGIVGVNVQAESESGRVPIQKISPAVQREAIARVRAHRRKRSAKQSALALRQLSEATQSGQNLHAAALAAIADGCTLGEIAQVWRDAFGEYREFAGF